MSFLNEAEADRGVRMLTGILLIAGGWALSLSTLGIALFLIGAIALGTGIVGWCPAYSLFHISTLKTPVDHCPNCEPDRHHL
jgi:DUF2892 family protein